MSSGESTSTHTDVVARPQFVMPPTTEKEPNDPLEIIQIEDRELMDAYIIYSPNASDEELETMWILAKKEDLVPLESAR